MAAIDMSLDDIIKRDDGKNRGGRRTAPGAAVVRGGRPAPSRNSGRPAASGARARAAPYSRGGRGSSDGNHMSGASLQDVAASGNAVLKVNGQSQPNKVAGAICNVVRESPNGQPPSILATGPSAINQAIKAVAAAKRMLNEENNPSDVVVTPKFEQDVRNGSNLVLELKKSLPIDREPCDEDLSATEKTDCFKLAGAIAGRVRDNEQVAITTKGAVPILVVVKAIALAQDYLQDENIAVKFGVQFCDMEDPRLRGQPTSTYLHFAILPREA